MEIKLNTEDIKKHLVHYYKIIAFGGLLFGIVWLGEHGYNAACVGLMGGGLGEHRRAHGAEGAADRGVAGDVPGVRADQHQHARD